MKKYVLLFVLAIAFVAAFGVFHYQAFAQETAQVEQSGFQKFITTLKAAFAKVDKTVDSSQISAAATQAVLASENRATEAPKYVHEMNHELLKNGINYNSKSVFAKKEFKQQAEKNIFNVLAERKKVLLAMLKENPKMVGAYALPLLTRSLLPDAAQGLYEEPKTVTGTLVVFHQEDFMNLKEHEADFQYQIVNGNKRYKFYPTQPISVAPGTEVTVKGLQLDDNLIGDITRQGNTPARLPAQVGEDGARVAVPHKMLVILAHYSDATTTPFTTAVAQSKIFSGQFKNFYNEQSYGGISFSGDVYGWYMIPRTTGSCENPSLGWGGDLDSYITSQSINLANYQHVLIITNCSGGYAKGSAFVGASPIFINNQVYTLSVSWVNGSGANFLQNSMWSTSTPPTFSWTNLDSMVTHEVGHGLGLWHANGYDCGSTTLDTASMGQSATCTHKEYGNPFDIMGDQRGYGFHTNAFYKEMMGWLDGTNMITATASGNYTLAPYENTTGKKAVKIQLANGTAPYYVEWRQSTGFDSMLSNSTISSNKNGLIITRAYSDSMQLPYNQARMLDARATSSLWTDDIKTTSFNSTTGTFSDPRTGVTIGPITSKTASAIKFNVTVAPVACVRKNPTFLYADSYGLTIGPGSSFAIFPTVWNDDYTGCAPANMLVTMTLPSGMTASPLTYTMSNVAAENSATAQLPTITASGTIAPGTYNINLTAKNMASNKTSVVSVPITVVQ